MWGNGFGTGTAIMTRPPRPTPPAPTAAPAGFTGAAAGTILPKTSAVLTALPCPPGRASFAVGLRLVRSASAGSGSVQSSLSQTGGQTGGAVLIAYFSWGGNTRSIAEELQRQTGADLFEIRMVNPYSTDYSTVLDQAQQAQNNQDRPKLSTHVENMEQYSTILLGYPNWWASIPMPVASFLEEYDFAGKTILPFCSHGGGRFGQSLTAIAKLAPNAELGEGLAISYSGGASLSDDAAAWLETVLR